MLQSQSPWGPEGDFSDRELLKKTGIFLLVLAWVATAFPALPPIEWVALGGIALLPVALYKLEWGLAFLIFALGFGSREFAYFHIRVGGLPLYAAEVGLAALLLAVFLRSTLQGQIGLIQRPWGKWLFLYQPTAKSVSSKASISRQSPERLA